MAPIILSLNLPVHSQDTDQLDSSNFSSPITKKLAAQALQFQSDELKTTMINFVNSSQAPLMCKLQVSRIWEQVMRSRAGLEAHKQRMLTSRVPEHDKEIESQLLGHFTRELVITLNQIDSYCGGTSATKK